MNSLFFGIDNTSYPHARHIPLISIKYREKQHTEVQSFLDDISSFTHLIFMSKHGVQALMHLIDPVQLAGKKIISIGSKTSATLHTFGIDVDITSKEETQEGILHELNILDLKTAYIGIPCSSRSRKTLATLLAYKGVRFLIGYLYDTYLVDDALLPSLDTVEELIFTSPSTVDAFKKYFDNVPAHLTFQFQGPITKQRFEEVFPQLKD